MCHQLGLVVDFFFLYSAFVNNYYCKSVNKIIILLGSSLAQSYISFEKHLTSFLKLKKQSEQCLSKHNYVESVTLKKSLQCIIDFIFLGCDFVWGNGSRVSRCSSRFGCDI